MSHRLSNPGRPADYATDAGFPDVRADAPVAVQRSAAICREITALVARHGLRQVARQAAISHSTLSRTLSGETWLSNITIANIEEALNTELWRP